MTALPTNLTKSEIIEQYWFEFLQSKKGYIRSRMKSGLGLPNESIDEQAFWTWYVTEKMDSDAS